MKVFFSLVEMIDGPEGEQYTGALHVQVFEELSFGICKFVYAATLEELDSRMREEANRMKIKIEGIEDADIVRNYSLDKVVG